MGIVLVGFMNNKQLKSHRDLRVWQASMDFVVDIYSLTRSFPNEERFGLVSQMRRCAVSIPSKIAEGYSRRSRRDYLRFLRIAHGSAAELDTQLDIANRLGYILLLYIYSIGIDLRQF